MSNQSSINEPETQQALEAAAFRTLVAHFQERTDVQNIDLMNMAGFCRNCLAKWYAGAAADQGLELDYESAREIIYGVPYAQWKDSHQKKATPEQIAEYNEKFPKG